MITGSIVALVTPMQEHNRSIDWIALEKLVSWHIEQGTDAIVAVGTTGESATLNVTEHARVIEFVVDKADGKIPIIAGTGANATDEAIHLTKAAKAVGADACLLVTPYYNKPTQNGLYEHFSAISDAVDIDQILYNVPSRTACDILPETVLKLSSRANIVGIKEATGDLQRAKILLEQVPSNFAVYSGDDATARELILLGGHGDISVTANVAPKLMSEMCAAALNGDFERACRLDNQLSPLHSGLFLEANPIPVKWALGELGMIEKSLRLPMTELSEQYHSQVRSALEHAGVI